MGQVRIPVTIDKAEEAIRELRRLTGGIKSMGEDAKRSASSLEQIGKSYTAFRRNVESFNQLRGVFSTFINVARSAAQAIDTLAQRTPRTRQELDRFKTTAGQVADEFVRGLDSGRRFSGMFTEMSSGMTGAADSARTLGEGISALVSGLRELNRVVGALQTGGLTEFFGAIRRRAMASTENVERLLNTGSGMEGGASAEGWRYNPNAEAEENLPRPGSGAGDQGAGSRRWGDTRTRRRGRGGGGGSMSSAEAEAARWSEAKEREQVELESSIAAQYRAQGEALREVFSSLDSIAALEQRRMDATRLNAEVMREEADKTKEQLTQQMEIERELAEQREEWASKFVGSVGSIANASQGLAKSVIGAYEAMGGSSEKAKKAEGAFVVAYSSVMAVLELAESIRAFAKQDYVSGALHLVGMAAYIAAAVEAGSQLGGGAAKTPSAQTSYTPARTEGLGASSGEQQGTTIINQYSWGRSRAEAAEAVADIEYEGARTGRVRASDSSVWGA